MNILVLTRYSRLGASSRLRSLQYVNALAGSAIKFQVFPLLNDDYLRTIYAGEKVSFFTVMSAYWNRLKILRNARNFDVVWIEKELFPNFPCWFELLLARFRVPYVVDYDDAIFHNYDASTNPFLQLLKNKIDKVMLHAALVTVGNSYLGHRAIKAGSNHVTILPTVIDIRRYPPPLEQINNERLVIGWIGSPSTVKFLQPLLPVLARLTTIFPLELTVIGAKIDAPDYGFIRCVAWDEATEVEEIGRFDIGVMPLPDKRWERGKCAYKLIQYMACGKPVVASPVGMNVDVVQEGINGLLADTDEAWFHALFHLLTDVGLRQTMGRHGRRLVEEKYCLQVMAPKLLQLFEQVLSDKRKN
jgi:glycosyltransferase involved in cell wall biosynthesis